MKKNTRYLALALPALVVIFCSCDFSKFPENEEETPDSIAIMTWNMQAMFDGQDHGNEYEEYKEAANWSAEKYSRRLSAIASAVNGMNTVPDIIAIQELESARVIGDLAEELSGQGYAWAHFAGCADMSLGIGVLSRLPVTETHVHSITIDGNTAPRPVLEVRVRRKKKNADTISGENESLVLFICHWKSKLGGADITENTRRASARIILRRIRELAEQEPELPVIVMGDFNENHDEFFRRNGEAICALLPDNPLAAQLTGFQKTNNDDLVSHADTQKDFIILCGNKPPQARHFPASLITLYSPWLDDMQNGSYYYKNEWETIDHFLLSSGLFDEDGWEFDECLVIDSPPFAAANGRPAAYNPRTGSGLSDHLPLLLFLKWQQQE